MFRPQIQKTRVLVVLAVINLTMVYIANQNTTPEKAPGYDMKIEAASIHSEALDVLRSKAPFNPNQYQVYDANITSLISDTSFSSITTGKGNLKAKQTTVKVDFSALIVDYLINSDIVEGDTIAVGMTGSMPGANIALLSACKSMGIYPVIISSLGASQFGATDTSFTWIDMEQALKDTIFSNTSKAYSLGGKGDCLKGEKYNEGRDLLKAKIKSYNGEEIYCNHMDINSLRASIDQRMEIYKENIDTLINYKVYVNIGGGAASVGIGGRYVFNTAGYLSPDEVEYKVSNAPSENPDFSIIKSFADLEIPTIHILRIKQFVKDNIVYGEDEDGKESSLVEGSELYEKEKYKLLINILALLVSLGSVGSIGIISHNQIKRRMQSYEPDSIL